MGHNGEDESQLSARAKKVVYRDIEYSNHIRDGKGGL